ncbi:MAG: TAXI family TRAP transporter solute-binding subunit [Rubrivivax sp.]
MKECLNTLATDSGSALAVVPQALDPVPPDIGMGSGPRGQTYYEVASNLAQAANAHGVPLVNIETKGTFQNLSTVVSKRNMALVFAQADALEAVKASEQRSVRMVMSLYQEEVHVLSRRTTLTGNTPLLRLADLKGRRVLVSDRSDGSAYTTRRLLKLAGMEPGGDEPQPKLLAGAEAPRPPTVTVQTMAPTRALCSVIVGEAEAMVIVAGQPVGLLRAVQRLAHHPAHPLDPIQFMPLSVTDLRAASVAGVSPVFYEPARIERRSYPWAFDREDSRADVKTLAVRALLMSYDFSPRANAVQRQKCTALGAVVKLLKDPEVQARLCQLPNHRKWCRFDPDASVPGWQANTCL